MGGVSSTLAGSRTHQCLTHGVHPVEEVEGLSGLPGLPHQAYFLLAGGSHEVSQGPRFREYDKAKGGVTEAVSLSRDFDYGVASD